MSTNIRATVTDSLGGSSADERQVAISGSSVRTIRRSMWQDRATLSSMEFKDSVYGPELVTFEDFPIEAGVTFRVQRPVRIVGIRIYKHPDAEGIVPVTLWDLDGGIIARQSVAWEKDGGGWREIFFDTPVEMPVDTHYVASYWSPTGHVAHNPWVYNGYDYMEWPFVVEAFHDGKDRRRGSRRGWTNSIPSEIWHANYYVDPIAEWEEEMPGPGTGLEYFKQFPNGGPSPENEDKFFLAVFYPDPPFLEDYASIGLTTAVGIPIDWAPYRQPVIDSGLDVWAYTWNNDAFAGDPELAERIRGYIVWDEPDMVHNGGYPHQVRDAVNQVRNRDSTRPVALNLGAWAPISISYQWWPVGASVQTLNQHWRQYGQIPDVISCDWYAMNGKGNEQNGPWVYAIQVQKMRQLSDGRLPVFAYIETCPIQNASRPTPELVKQTCWVSIIAGAKGIVFFDHQFKDNEIPTDDFAWALHNEPMRSGLTAIIADIHSHAKMLYSKEVDLVTSVESSNSTAGPRGGVWGVPMHYTGREYQDSYWLIAQSIRPGSTTATFKVPSARYQQIEVVGEGRTITANSRGEFSDDYSSDYEHHIYKWSTTPVPGPEGVTILTSALAEMTAGEAYSYTLEAQGTGPIEWAVSAGSLPEGLTLTQAGVIEGTPVAGGPYDFTVLASNVTPESDTHRFVGDVGVKVTPEEPTTTYVFDYVNRLSFTADGWSFTGIEGGWGAQDTEVTEGPGRVVYNDGGALRLPTPIGGIWADQNTAKNLITREVGPEFRSATVHISGQWSAPYSMFGLYLYGNNDRYWGIQRAHGDAGNVLYGISEWAPNPTQFGTPTVHNQVPCEVEDLWLRIVRREDDDLDVYWSEDGDTWQLHTTITIPADTYSYAKLALLASSGPSDYVDYVRIHEVTVVRDI